MDVIVKLRQFSFPHEETNKVLLQRLGPAFEEDKPLLGGRRFTSVTHLILQQQFP